MVKPGQDEVDKAAAAARRGINRLIVLLGHEDRAVLINTALALNELGAKAIVGPLIAALPRAKAPAHRMAIVGVLTTYTEERKAQIGRALVEAQKRERDPMVANSIRGALTRLITADIAAQVHENRRAD